MRGLRFLLLTAGFLGGCHLIGGTEGFVVDESPSDDDGNAVTSSSSVGGGATTSSSATTTGQGGGPIGCRKEACPGDITQCGAPACIDDLCDFLYEPPRTVCSSGTVAAGICDGLGACVQCINVNDCSGSQDQCIDGFCVGPSCTNNMPDGDETDVDCGGPLCPGCDNGKSCLVNADCKTLYCRQGDLKCTYCSNQSECPMGFYCSGGDNPFSNSDNRCLAKKNNGVVCFNDYECKSGNCPSPPAIPSLVCVP